MKAAEYKDIIIFVVVLSLLSVVVPLTLDRTVKLSYRIPINMDIKASKDFEIPKIKKTIAPTTREKFDKIFKEPETQPLEEKGKVTVEVNKSKNLHVNMIIISEAQKVVSINNIFLKEGDSIEGFKVEKIHEKGVLLSRKGEFVWIE